MTYHRPKRCQENGGNCVEVDLDNPNLVMVRDSKDPGPELYFDYAEWCAFIEAVKAGQYDLPEEPLAQA